MGHADTISSLGFGAQQLFVGRINQGLAASVEFGSGDVATPGRAFGSGKKILRRRQRLAGDHELRGRREEQLVRDDQILIEHRPVHELLIRIAHQRVVSEHEERLHRVRIAIRHRPEHRRRMRHVTTHHDVRIAIAVHAFRRDELMSFDVTLLGDRVPCVQVSVAPGTRKGPAVKRPSAS